MRRLTKYKDKRERSSTYRFEDGYTTIILCPLLYFSRLIPPLYRIEVVGEISEGLEKKVLR